MSTHSSPPISVGQNVLLPNPTTPLSVTPSVTPSRMQLIRSELIELKQLQLDQFEYLDQQRQIENAETKANMKLILERLNPLITSTTERTSLDRRSADLEQPILDEISINLQQTETKSNQPKSVATPPLQKV